MANLDRSADPEASLKWELAVMTAAFATEQAVERLRQMIKLGRTGEIIECANYAASAVQEIAHLVTVSGEDADTSVTVQASVASCLRAMTRAVQADDADGVVNAGELIADAVVNRAEFLKNSVPRQGDGDGA